MDINGYPPLDLIASSFSTTPKLEPSYTPPLLVTPPPTQNNRRKKRPGPNRRPPRPPGRPPNRSEMSGFFSVQISGRFRSVFVIIQFANLKNAAKIASANKDFNKKLTPAVFYNWQRIYFIVFLDILFYTFFDILYVRDTITSKKTVHNF